MRLKNSTENEKSFGKTFESIKYLPNAKLLRPAISKVFFVRAGDKIGAQVSPAVIQIIFANNPDLSALPTLPASK